MNIQKIESKIHEIRGVKVMLDYDLAKLYEVETKYLNLAIDTYPTHSPNKVYFRSSEIQKFRIHILSILKPGQSIKKS